jgi:integrase/recombinase XerD
LFITGHSLGSKASVNVCHVNSGDLRIRGNRPRLLEAAPGVKYKAALSVACGAGLRVSEVVSLKVSDIDSKRMMLRVEQGKGGKDRHAMLSPQLLELLRDWWRIARPQVWLFPGLDPINPMSTRQLNRACHAAAQLGRWSINTLT